MVDAQSAASSLAGPSASTAEVEGEDGADSFEGPWEHGYTTVLVVEDNAMQRDVMHPRHQLPVVPREPLLPVLEHHRTGVEQLSQPAGAPVSFNVDRVLVPQVVGEKRAEQVCQSTLYLCWG